MIENLPDRIFLCGFMGAGKSTVARRIAKRLDMDFVDLDELIEQKAGRDIPDIFKKEGEASFRKLERETLLSVCRSQKGIVALGGGSLQSQHLVDHLKLNGLLIFIDTPFSIIFERINKKSGRPLLTDKEGRMKPPNALRNEMQELYEKRLPLYRQSTITVDGSAEPSEVVERLIKKINNHVTYH